MKVLGIDPSFTSTGVAFGEVDVDGLNIHALQLIHTRPSNEKKVRKSSDDLERARVIHGTLHNQIREWKPDLIAAEIPTGSQSARSSWTLGIVLGVLSSIPGLIEVSASEVKESFVGSKTASKDAMIEEAVRRHPYAPWLTKTRKGETTFTNKNEHLADAVAVLHRVTERDEYHFAQRLLASREAA